MKQLLKIFVPVIVVALLMMLLATTMNRSEGYAGSNTLTIYNWGDYIDPSLITKFEKETGIKVIYQTFDSNEAMMTKIEQGGTTFDIAVPSDYAISKMKEENLLIPLDHSKLPNENTLIRVLWTCRLMTIINIRCLISGERLALFIIKKCSQIKISIRGMRYLIPS